MARTAWRRREFFGALVAGTLLPATARARDSALPVPASLSATAEAATRLGEPLVLLVTLPGCPYCELVRRSYLLPARQDAGLHAWQLDVSNRTTALLGFDGKPTTAARQTAAWKASFTPTVLFLGAQGQELAERLVGVAVPDFYGAYLEDRLAAARKVLAERR
ncbi:MAG: hypothetical protein EAZ34_10250 [Polaromonas sp.]|nr:MAG: hypothetical protein EAZ34_10250 [Polaromonas sp.]